MRTKHSLIGLFAISCIAGGKVKSADISQTETWVTNEATDWDGKWIRRENSNVFDIRNRNKVNGAEESHIATVTVAGNEMRAEREDKKHYRGNLSGNGRTIEGMITDDKGGSGRWIVTIPQSVAQVPMETRLAIQKTFPAPVSQPAASQPEGLNAQQQFTILKAVYSGGDVQRDVTSILSANIREGKVLFNVQNQALGGDPCFGKVKTLTVSYRDANGDFTASAREGQRLEIPNPKNNRAETDAQFSKNPIVQVQIKPRLAPEGIYFLLRPMSITTDASIIGLPPGTELHLLRDDGTTLHVKSGEYELDVSKMAISNDLNAVEAAFGSYAAAQARIANWAQMQAAVDERRESEKRDEAKKQMLAVERTSMPSRSAPAGFGRSNPLNQGSYEKSPLAGAAHFKMNSDSAQSVTGGGESQVMAKEKEDRKFHDQQSKLESLRRTERQNIEQQVKDQESKPYSTENQQRIYNLKGQLENLK